MRVLVACEFSGRVRDAFIAKGHDAWSCDLIPTEKDGPHFQEDIRDILSGSLKWDLMIAHPPCTYLCVSGAAWFKREGRKELQDKSIEFCEMLWNAPIPKIAIENPVGVLSTRSKLAKPSQIIQPWYFGEPQWKKTCLWLKGLKRLTPTNILQSAREDNHRESPSEDRWKNRSRTYQGIADAMAEQWGA